MAVSVSHSKRRDSLFERARSTVRKLHQEFAAVVAELDSLYPEADAIERWPILTERDERSRLLARIWIAWLDAFADPDARRTDLSRFGFERIARRDVRRAAAQRVIAVALLAGDPHADDVIDTSWGELASLPWGTPDDDGPGRALCIWPPEGDWKEVLEPSPEHLDRLEHAVEILERDGKGADPPDRRTKWTHVALAEHIGRDRGTLLDYRDKAVPPVAKRKRGEQYTTGELERIAQAFENSGEHEVAATLRELIAEAS